MSNPIDSLGKVAIAKTTQGEEHGRGRIIAHCDAPTYTIEREDGSRFHWRADMCEVREEYSYATAGFHDLGYVIYGPDGERIEPYDLVKLLNSQFHKNPPNQLKCNVCDIVVNTWQHPHGDMLHAIGATLTCPVCGRPMEWVEV